MMLDREDVDLISVAFIGDSSGYCPNRELLLRCVNIMHRPWLGITRSLIILLRNVDLMPHVMVDCRSGILSRSNCPNRKNTSYIPHMSESDLCTGRERKYRRLPDG